MSKYRGIQREYKDRLFKFLFGSPSRKELTLSLYNATNGSHYTDADALEFTTIEDVVYMGMKNDVSFLIDGSMCFFEEQSTPNPNMPARFFSYAGMAYSRRMKMEPSFDLYSLDLQPLPDPIFICLCAAPNMKEERVTLRLSDAFGKNSRKRLELVVDVININYGYNQEFLDSCPALKDYSFFISRFRYYLKRGKSPEEAAQAAITDMADDSIIKPLLLANQAEVKRMCILEYDEEKTLNGRLETGIRIGREEGRAEERAKMFKMLDGFVADGLVSIKEAAKRAGVSVAEFRRLTGR